jgi:hypothetical protein
LVGYAVILVLMFATSAGALSDNANDQANANANSGANANSQASEHQILGNGRHLGRGDFATAALDRRQHGRRRERPWSVRQHAGRVAVDERQ